MSPALLSARLRKRHRAGIVEWHIRDGRSYYTVTRSGREPAEVVRVLCTWAASWATELTDDDLDLSLLTRDIRRNLPVDNWPQSPAVVAFRMSCGAQAATGGG